MDNNGLDRPYWIVSNALEQPIQRPPRARRCLVSSQGAGAEGSGPLDPALHEGCGLEELPTISRMGMWGPQKSKRRAATLGQLILIHLRLLDWRVIGSAVR